MVTRKLRGAKGEHHLSFTFRLAFRPALLASPCTRRDFGEVLSLARDYPAPARSPCKNPRFRDRQEGGIILGSQSSRKCRTMSDTVTTPKTKVKTKVERPRLHKVILINDDYTPREFVVTVLKAEFRMTEDQAYKVMLTAHQRGVCVVAVFTKDVAETKATRATDAGRAKGYPLLFTTEPEE
jgi:ATP-dependent Clp protease adaptor protein ClpS